ncbi:MAG: type I-F CRISPR-associated endoribonuclease Cas6/Csy4 [Porticoccaceae bacterium]|nr:type I-F CRISPR-associated endoribonuclease Cas6/Csy4 [Porticoccaceae bacterium]
MDHYVDIRLLPDPEFTTPMLMGALFGKLHRALVELKADHLGVSFPQYQLNPKTLGAILRIHGTEQGLSGLMQTGWLKGMADHIAGVEIRPVPQTGQCRVVKRRQYKTNVERLRRRRMKRKEESYEQATAAIPASVERQPELPFVTLRSQSTGQAFCVFIELGELQAEGVPGSFNRYGLGQQATVPWF